MISQNPATKKDFDHPVLNKLPDKFREEVLQRLEYRSLVAGTVICRQGDPGDGFFMIRSGTVRIFQNSGENRDLEPGMLGPGDSFGEMALLTGAPRTASAVVVEDAELTFLSKEQFDRILHDYPVESLPVIRQMAAWLMDHSGMPARKPPRTSKPPRLSIIDFAIIIFLSCLFALIFNHSNPNGIKLFPKISLNENIAMIRPSEAIYELRNGRAAFVDAMPSSFYEQEHIAGALNIPLSVFDIMYMLGLSGEDKSREIIVYGRTVSRLYDIQLANKLYLRGHKNIRLLEGGLSLWKKKGYPVAP